MFVGHSEKKKNHVLDIYCYDVNIVLMGAGLATCKFGCTFLGSRAFGVASADARLDLEREARPSPRDAGVIARKWPCVLPLVTC